MENAQTSGVGFPSRWPIFPFLVRTSYYFLWFSTLFLASVKTEIFSLANCSLVGGVFGVLFSGMTCAAAFDPHALLLSQSKFFRVYIHALKIHSNAFEVYRIVVYRCIYPSTLVEQGLGGESR